MQDLVTDYWWVSFITVPALAIAIKRIAEAANLVDSLSASLQRQLSSFAHSYPDHWVVTATTRDGRRFSRLVIDSRFRVASEAPLPFKLRDVQDVAWEGLVAPPVGPVVPISGDRLEAP